MAEPMPMPTERRAPKFDGNGRTLVQFLSDYKRLADAALLTESQAIERIVIYLAAGPRKLVERYAEFRRPTSWDAFRDRFVEDYLDAQEPDEYRRSDYDDFLVKSKADPPRSVDKLGEFTRVFRSMAADVQRAGGLSDVEMRKHYCTVLESAIGKEFRTRMLVEYKGKTRSEWLITEMLKQGKILLKEAEADADAYFPQEVGAATVPAAPSSSVPTVKIEEQLNVLFSRLTSRIEQLERTYRAPSAAHEQLERTYRAPSAAHVHVAPGAASGPTPAIPVGSTHAHVSASADLSCYYCGGTHRMPDCSLLQEDLAMGRCLKNEQGRVVYPNGETIRGGFGGKMRERVQEFNAAHPEYEKKRGASAAAMLVELGDAYFAPLQDCVSASSAPEFTAEDAAQAWASFVAGETFQYEEGERRRYNLRARQPASNAPVQDTRTKPPAPMPVTSATPVVRDTPPHLERGRVDRMPPSSPSKEKGRTVSAADRPGSATAQPPTPVPRSATIEEVPDDDAPPPAPPRPVTLPSALSAPRPQFQLRSSLETDGLAKVISERILRTQVALSVQDLLALSPSLRRHWHNETAVKRVTIGYTGADDAEQDARDVFHFERISQPGVSRDLIAAEVALPLRYLDCIVGDYRAEGVVDNGSQLVLISQKFWQALGCPLDKEHRINMTAANNSAALTKGLCANLEVQIGGITWYLQAHVVEDAPFSLLLGRPFLCVSSAREDNLPDGSTFLTLNDPNSGRAARIPTRARRNPRSAVLPADQPSGF